MQNHPRRPQFPLRARRNGANVTSAVGMEETVGHRARRRHSFFTHTVIWITGLICLAFLLSTIVQAWSNSALMAKVQNAKSTLQQQQILHQKLQHAVEYNKDPAVIESEARQRLGYVRPGEQSVVIITTDKEHQPATERGQRPAPAQGYWQDWWQVFFK